MNRFTFIRQHDAVGGNWQAAPLYKSELMPALAIPLMKPTPPPSPSACLTRQDAKAHLQSALLAARQGRATDASLASVVEVITHAVRYGSIKRILIEAGIAETLMSFLKQSLEQTDVNLMLRTLAALRLLLMESALPAVTSGCIEESFAILCLNSELCNYLSSIMERFVREISLLKVISEVFKLLLRVGLKVRKSVLSSGIIRFVTNQILSYTMHVNSVIILSDLLKFMMGYSSGYRRDHMTAIGDACGAMEAYPDNIHVARIVCILLSQRKTSPHDINSSPSAKLDTANTALRCMLQFRRDECVTRCALVVLTGVLAGDDAALTRSAVSLMLSCEICEACMQMLYNFRKKNCAMAEIINFVSTLDAAVTQGSVGREDLTWESQVKQALIVSTKMRLSELSMDHRWEARKGFCLFLAQHGHAVSPSPNGVASGPSAHPRLSQSMNTAFSARSICIHIASFM